MTTFRVTGISASRMEKKILALGVVVSNRSFWVQGDEDEAIVIFDRELTPSELSAIQALVNAENTRASRREEIKAKAANIVANWVTVTPLQKDTILRELVEYVGKTL